MSVIFGICAPRNSIVSRESMQRLTGATARYGIDATEIRVNGRVGMAFQAFHTHRRSRLEQQPTTDPSGNILALDGRLDNYLDLAESLGINETNLPDSTIALKAFERWGEDCFPYFVGDWALSLWSARDRVLYLARDHAGTRTLFFSNRNGEVKWSTYLETFFADGSSPDLDREYMARALASQAIGDLTPYQGIRAVSPAHYVAIREGHETWRPHWRWIADTSIVYKTDREYDEHFLSLFQQAVMRRNVPGAPRLAELSGGMDSSSIVCMADKSAEEGADHAELIDTVSYFDDTEPDWNEKAYFTAVENYRGKTGIHIDCSHRTPSYEPLILPDRIYPYPGADRVSLDLARQFDQSVGAGKYRIILSGIGGDELLGGVPTPMPELANLLRAGRLFRLFQRTSQWCKVRRQPFLQMLYQTLTFTGHLYHSSQPAADMIPPWLTLELRASAFSPQPQLVSTRELLGARPSAIANGHAWWHILETLHRVPHLLNCYEYRYPYLDRDLVEFLHRIPREQLVQPGRRRLLMRRALKDIVPEAILERKRKAFMSHGPIAKLREAQGKIEALLANSLIAEYGLVDPDNLLQAFRIELIGDLKWIQPLTKAIGVELWLRSLQASRLTLRIAATIQDRNQDPLAPYRANKIRANVARS